MTVLGITPAAVTMRCNPPIFMCPVEVLSDIFLRVQRETRLQSIDGDSEDIYIDPAVELTLYHVNTGFRNIAAATHCLWRHIIITPVTRDSQVLTYLALSGVSQLEVTFDAGFTALSDKALDAIFSQVHRWSWCSIHDNASILNRLSSVNAPLLEYLSIRFSDFPETVPDIANQHSQSVQLFKSGCPALSFLRLRGYGLSFCRPPIGSRVTTLHLDQTYPLNMSHAIFVQLLTTSKVLANLSIHGDILGPGSPWPLESTIEMPALQALRLCGRGPSMYSGFLIALSAPLLKSLILKGFHDEDLDKFHQLTTDPASRFPLMRSLTLWDFELPEHRYTMLFDSFPDIDEFTSMNGTVMPPGILDAMTKPCTGDATCRIPWPRLKMLTISPDFDEQFMIRDVVTSRIRCGRSLSKLCIFTSDVTMLRDFEDLNDLITVEARPFPVQWADGGEFADRDDYLLL